MADPFIAFSGHNDLDPSQIKIEVREGIGETWPVRISFNYADIYCSVKEALEIARRIRVACGAEEDVPLSFDRTPMEPPALDDEIPF